LGGLCGDVILPNEWSLGVKWTYKGATSQCRFKPFYNLNKALESNHGAASNLLILEINNKKH